MVRGNFPDNVVIIGNPAQVVTKTSVQRFLYLQSKGLLRTKNLSDARKAKLIKDQLNPDEV